MDNLRLFVVQYIKILLCFLLEANPSFSEYTGVAAIKAPEILSFRDVCCVGISVKTTLPLTNPTSRWLECILQIRQLYVDGQTVGSSVTVPFEMKQKVIVEPNTVEKIEVCLM
jgi:hypothetical protein